MNDAPDFAVFVPGVPRPQGSKTRNANGSMREASEYVKAWRQSVVAASEFCMAEMRHAIQQATGGIVVHSPLEGPLALGVEFLFARPRAVSGTRAHWRSCEGCKGRNWRARSMACTICEGTARRLRADAPVYFTGAPDLDKLHRAIQDSLEAAGVCRNDSMFVQYPGSVKRYANPGEQPGARIRVWRLT